MNQLYCVGCNSSGGHRNDKWFVYEWYSKKTVKRFHYKQEALVFSRKLNAQVNSVKDELVLEKK
jgi:hypothetical protein